MSEDRLVPLSAENDDEQSSEVRRAFAGTRTKDLRLDLGPRGVGQMLDQAMEIFRRGFFRYVVVVAFVCMPERIIQVFFGEHASAGLIDQGDLSGFQALGVSGFASFLVSYLSLALVARMAYSDLKGERESAWGGVLGVLRRSPGLLVLTAAISMINVVAMLLCCIPVLFTAWKLQLALYALVLEDQPLGASFQRGWDLSRGSFFRFLGLAAVAGLLGTGWGVIAGAPFASWGREPMKDALGIGGPFFDLIFVPLSALLIAVGIGYSGVLWVVYYADQRVRLEGLDLSLRLEKLESGDPETATGTSA